MHYSVIKLILWFFITQDLFLLFSSDGYYFIVLSSLWYCLPFDPSNFFIKWTGQVLLINFEIRAEVMREPSLI